MTCWTYKGKPFTSQDIKHNFGFVYKITNLEDKRMYVGRKYFWSTTRKKPLKGKKNKRVIKKESNWQDYWGSCKELLDNIAKLGKDKFTREIISLHPTKGQTNYAETQMLFSLDVLNNDKYLNGNILGRWFKKDNTQG